MIDAEKLGEFMWKMNAPVWKSIQMIQAVDYANEGYTTRVAEENNEIVGYAVWHDQENGVRILDALAYEGNNFGKLKEWFHEATDTKSPIVLNVQGKHKKLTDFYLRHGFEICEETPFSYIMKKEGGE